MGEVSFTLDVTPKGWARARVSRKAGKPRFFKSAAQNAYYGSIRSAAMKAMGKDKIFLGAVELTVTFSMPMPKSWSLKKRNALAGEMHAQTPDCDNLVKAVCDAANGVLWADDAQVAAIDAQKIWAEAGGIAVIVATVT